MTGNGITDTLNMKSLEEILAETEISNEIEEVAEEEKLPAPIPQPDPRSLMDIQQMRGTDHAKAMDDLYVETLDVARKIVDMGMNIDPSKAPRMFEVANQYFKMAADTKISKRDAELKLMKLIMDQQKLDMDDLRLKHELGDTSAIKGDIVMIEDRNKLLEQLRKAKESDEK